MCPVFNGDWRLQGQERYLKGASFKLRLWASTNPQWDHDHCEFCYETIAGPDVADALHEAYATEDLYRWVCPDCFNDMCERFHFKVIGEA